MAKPKMTWAEFEPILALAVDNAYEYVYDLCENEYVYERDLDTMIENEIDKQLDPYYEKYDIESNLKYDPVTKLLTTKYN